MKLNKGEDEQSSLGKHIHLSQSTEQYHQAPARFHMLKTAKRTLVLTN